MTHKLARRGPTIGVGPLSVRVGGDEDRGEYKVIDPTSATNPARQHVTVTFDAAVPDGPMPAEEWAEIVRQSKLLAEDDQLCSVECSE